MNRNEMAGYAYREVPFYQEKLKPEMEQWEDLPLIDKRMMLRGMGRNIAPEYIMDEINGTLDRVLTSGSTGECLEVLWKREHNIKSLMPLWNLRKKWYGVAPWDKRGFFFTTKVQNGRTLTEYQDKNGLGFGKLDLSEERVIEIYRRLQAFRPAWLILQPSMAMLLIYTAEKFCLDRFEGLRYIELNGERFTMETRRRIREFFKCPVASQYGCYEANSIAYECPCGNLHVMTDNVYVEVLDEEGRPIRNSPGDIYLTSLQNRVMPFVRYRVGDRGILKEEKCSCGSSAPVLELLACRDNDWIINKDGSRAHSDLFCHAAEMVNLAMGHSLDQYQIVQRDYSDFDIYLVLDDKEEGEEVIRLFSQYLGDFGKNRRLCYHIRDYLRPNEETGKLAWFVSEQIK